MKNTTSKTGKSHISIFPPVLLLFFVLSCSFLAFTPDKTAFHKVSNSTEEQRIDSIIGAMTLEEKVAMLCGNTMFTSPGIERLGVPELHYTDGPFGVREEVSKSSFFALGWKIDSATFFPTGSALAATWNPDLAYKYGTAIGEEAKTRKKDILLGPAVNITRTPLNGRTFEYFSEDPLLNAKLTVGYIKGVQQSGVAACVKHFAANNQETNRGKIDVKMDERTLREIYLPAFKAAVQEAHVYTVMAAYNKFRGDYCAENDYLLNKILKGEWGFKGFVMSDWSGTHSTVNAALYGLDVEMGTKKYFTNNNLLEAVKKGEIPASVIDEKIKRILRVNFFAHRTSAPVNDTIVSTTAHGKIAYEIASQSIILLKNGGNLLPLNLEKIKSIAVIGDNATHKHAHGGFGAGVKARYEITPLDGLKARVGNKATIHFAQGYMPKYTPRQGRYGRDPVNVADSALMKEATDAAKNSDIAIIFAGDNHDVETEARDRKDLTLPFGQDDLIKAVSAVNKNTIVVIVAGAPVDLSTATTTCPAIVWSWFNGSEGGNALADILLGNINPSGRLPFTIPVKLEDSPAHALNAFPGDSSVTYSEGILVGYRWFDTKNIKPLYNFGYGLSYTSFHYSGLASDKTEYGIADTMLVTAKIKNTGRRNGLETVQLYVSKPNSGIMRPTKELRAFKKVAIESGKENIVKLLLPVRNLAYFDEKQMSWIIEPGVYTLKVGSSSQDIKGFVTVNVKY